MTIRETNKLEDLENVLDLLENALIEIKNNKELNDIVNGIEELIGQVKEELEPLQELENEEFAKEDEYMNSSYERDAM